MYSSPFHVQLNFVGTVLNQQLNQDQQSQQNILGQQQQQDQQVQNQLSQDQQNQQKALNQGRHLLANKRRNLMSFLPNLNDQVGPPYLCLACLWSCFD